MRPGLPPIWLGLLLVILALVKGVWPPDYVDRSPTHHVAHDQRMLGQDAPPGTEKVERRAGYIIFRVFDALVYLAIAQILIGSVAIWRTNDRFYWLMVAIAGLYGLVYAAASGLVIGAQVAFFGFCSIFLASGLGWISTGNSVRTDDESYSVA